uniref:Uncharacterized protein n=1 Tax=Cyprinus carpio TaxID=7962 RepID=A0A8C1W595_CYPCA
PKREHASTSGSGSYLSSSPSHTRPSFSLSSAMPLPIPPNTLALEPPPVASNIRTQILCLCGRCRPMETALESLCCREVSHPGFESCCLNPFVLKIAYTHFRQDHGPLQASTHDLMNQKMFPTYSSLGNTGTLHTGRLYASCLVSAVRQQFHSGDKIYHGFQWPRLDENE